MPLKRKKDSDKDKPSRGAKRKREDRSSSQDRRDHSYAVVSSHRSSATSVELLSESARDRRSLIPTDSVDRTHVSQSFLSLAAPTTFLRLNVSSLSTAGLLPHIPSSTNLAAPTGPSSSNSSEASVPSQQTNDTASSTQRLLADDREQRAQTADDANTQEISTNRYSASRFNQTRSIDINETPVSLLTQETVSQQDRNVSPSTSHTLQTIQPQTDSAQNPTTQPEPIPNEHAEVHDVPVRLPNYPAFHYNPQNLYEDARIGSMSATCRHCSAKKWPTEPPRICCANGKVDVPLLGPPPEPLQALLTTNTPQAKEFRKKYAHTIPASL